MLLLVAIVSYWKNACHAFSDALKLFCLPACLPACLSVCLCLSLSVCLSVSQSVSLSVCLSFSPSGVLPASPPDSPTLLDLRACNIRRVCARALIQASAPAKCTERKRQTASEGVAMPLLSRSRFLQAALARSKPRWRADQTDRRPRCFMSAAPGRWGGFGSPKARQDE